MVKVTLVGGKNYSCGYEPPSVFGGLPPYKVVFYADEPLSYVTNRAGTAEILYYDHWATIGEGGEAVYNDK